MSTRIGLLALVLASCTGVGCADNATSLADRVREAASRLGPEGSSASSTTSYEPVRGSASPYSVVFFPNRPVAESELVAAGIARETAGRIYADLAYLGSMSNLLVVDQEGQRLSFTSSWKHVAEAKDLVVVYRKTGPAVVELRREDGAVRVVAVR